MPTELFNHEILSKLLIICPLVFFAGFVDAIAGGGGIISLPAYIVANVPYHVALGTNKFASTFGTSLSMARFIKNRHVHFLSAATAAFFAIIGSHFGARIALLLSDVFLRYTLVVALPVLTVFILFNKNFGKERVAKKDFINNPSVIISASVVAGLVLGCYDGFFGPGTGTFLILIFNAVLGFDLLTSNGNAKVVNFASNVAALYTFLRTGNVMLYLGIPAAVCSIAGNYLGSGLAIKNGVKIIRPMFVVVLILLLCKIVFDLMGFN